ncbi:MAG TPA: lipopolysaccharide kinase InaA family protein [Salinimicrobium sp.]|nr:lipopolysaccharide kinase InaA family protein [Salinimicrobium sp.]
MKAVFSEKYKDQKDEIHSLVRNFENEGELFGAGDRNQIKIFELNGNKINVKAFKVPNLFNKIVYKFFRQSKAERSFDYANRLISKNIGTPHPIAYIEEKRLLGFGKSYYVSEHLTYDLTYRELTKDPNYPRKEEILRAFTKFTFHLHEQEIEFLDHSPGNTLIKFHDAGFEFFLVDLNRMNFRQLNLDERMKNFSRLTSKREIVEIMANEYAILTGKPEKEIFEKMWFYVSRFQDKFRRKKRLKRTFKV